jgi:hypothetical protein
MLGPQVNSLYLHTVHITETNLIQDIMSCMAGDMLVEFLNKLQVEAKEAEVMLNYKKDLSL